jgi:hypothetical protein
MMKKEALTDLSVFLRAQLLFKDFSIVYNFFNHVSEINQCLIRGLLLWSQFRISNNGAKMLQFL